MAQQTTSPAQSDLLKEWSEKSLMNRLLLPGDLLDQVNADSEENLTCHKTTTEYLTITDSRQQKTIKLGDMDNFPPTSNTAPAPSRTKPSALCPAPRVLNVTIDREVAEPNVRPP